jgi:hypothetical protein
MSKLHNILSKLKIIHFKYQKIDETSINSFNIFSILRKENDEVNLHSKFIYELLNPNGSHRQQDTFLKLFLKEINIQFSTVNMDIFREKFNIDILIQNKNYAIIIENKIDTQDHSNQLSKYLKKVKSQGYKDENISLIYLTLLDEIPNEESMRDRVINITYSEYIRNWIEHCIIEVATLPTLRERLVQYLALINKLTYQSDNKGFIMEIKNLLLEDNNLETILNISDAIIEAKIEIQLNFWRELTANLNQYYKFKFYNLNSDITLEKSVNRYYKLQKNKREYGVEYQLDDNLYFYIELRENIFYGFEFYDDEKITKYQENKLNSIKINWEGKYWKYSDKILDFEKFNTKNVLNLIDKKSREHDIKIISDEVINLINQYKKGE